MSLPWRDEVGLLIAPTCVVATRRSGGFRSRFEDEFQTVEPDDEGGYGRALQAVSELLQATKWQRADARIVIADAWVRYAMVPWVSGLTLSERLVHSWHVFEQAYGDMRQDWTLTLTDTAPGGQQLACAMPNMLLETLSSLAATARLRIQNLQPQLVVAFNCSRRLIPVPNGWFVSMAAGSLAAAQFGPGGWQQVRSVRIGSDWAAELQRLRRFGQLTASTANEGRIFVDAPYWVRKMADSGLAGLEILEQPETGRRSTLQMLVALKGVCA